MSDTKNELKTAYEEVTRNMGTFMAMGTTIAKIRRAHYKAYITEGFTPQEALELCKSIFL